MSTLGGETLFRIIWSHDCPRIFSLRPTRILLSAPFFLFFAKGSGTHAVPARHTKAPVIIRGLRFGMATACEASPE
jgi:hypothetical protein